MLKKLLFIFYIIINFTHSQNTIGTTLVTNQASDGYTLFSAFTETYLINNCGQVINQWSSNFTPGNAVYLLKDGSILRAGKTETQDITFGGQGGVIEIFDWSGNLTWQYFYDTLEMRQHHDVFPMPNGNILILAVTRLSNSEAIQLGRNPALLTESDLYNEQIIEVTPIGTNNAQIVWEWNVKDHVVQDYNSTKDNFGNVSLSPEKLNINFLNGGNGDSNWLHFNSIYFNSILDQIVISSRNLSEIYIIDHSTTTIQASSNTGGTYGKGGDLLYRWGNPQAYNQGSELDRKLYGQHSPYVIEPGFTDENKIMVYNNGRGREEEFSEVYILNPQTESPGVYSHLTNTPYSPSEPDYTYGNTGSEMFYSSTLSSSQRLSNGNTLICEGANGRFFEINENKDIVWEYINPINTTTGNVISQGANSSSFINVSFRAHKYESNYEAFRNKDLTPGNPIEINSNITPCQNLSTTTYKTPITKLYPNPTNKSVKIISNTIINKIEVYNLVGQKISSTTLNNIDLTDQVNGVYFFKIHTNTSIITKKVIKK
ncbi:aryl-sulfate sulfotransferase [Winogradskyella undariae]|uniref:aryl-sulfate sulfotransferase n=1 Tax=Winogradskyella TaxID=286104 RepID=UPI00156A9B18|nr:MULTISPECIES: aryl-sulfate sulfotransferase [Winogradskyella]NRR91655.1 aryl-sulfate sulfotransferase [Winogradskyella undariae]QXP77868.1 aryl-sulfate sulfotransferase [Winogradskyella sp. HaHa_3_26]